MSRVAPTRGDLVLAGLVTVAGVLSVIGTEPAEATGVTRDSDALAVLIGILATAPIAWRRAAPFAVLVATTAGFMLAAARGYAVAAGGVGPIIAVASVAYFTDRRGAIVGGAGLAIAAVVGTELAFRGESGEGVQVAAAFFIAVLATVIGDLLRTRDAAVRELEARNRELDALREVEAREAVAQDRVRIARDVHDVVGHALAGIALQARAGLRLVRRDADRTETALGEIDALATRALAETREAVGLIRGDGEGAQLRPQPRLDDLDELVARLQDDELRVELRREGDATGVPGVLQASAYRIVQEALSNVVKHARPATAVVTVAVADDALRLEVRDDGRRAPADDGRGHGLGGMRDRAAQCGGTLEAGPGPDGGWLVRARLPVARQAA
jgi:signal transduction histidine kinase